MSNPSFPEATMVQFTKGELEIMRILQMRRVEAGRYPGAIPAENHEFLFAVLSGDPVGKGASRRGGWGRRIFIAQNPPRIHLPRHGPRLLRICFDGSLDAMLCHLIRSRNCRMRICWNSSAFRKSIRNRPARNKGRNHEFVGNAARFRRPIFRNARLGIMKIANLGTVDELEPQTVNS